MPDLWDQVLETEWRSTPYIAGRQATGADVLAGIAVFFVQGQSTAAELDLPCLGTQRREDGTETRVIVVLAEHAPSCVILGVRYLTGGNGVCSMSEVELESQ
jgi:hypothetical protein